MDTLAQNKINRRKTRFAPSPTGYLHVGNARTALVNYLYAKKYNGHFLLRIDDTDPERSKKLYEEQILKDLEWLGLKWDSFVRQSERLELYEKAKEFLIAEGRIYECFESSQELEMQRKIQLSRGLPPIYNRKSLHLTNQEKEMLKQQGVKPHYRFLLKDEKIEWHDKVRGSVAFLADKLSDPIIIREDGSMTYLLTSTMDDIDLGITDIIRGEDHVTNTAIQIQLFEAMKGNLPTFSHLSLINHKEGKISKRKGGFDIKTLAETFIEPMTICNFFAKLGTSDSIKSYTEIQPIIEEFDITKFGKSQTSFSEEELLNLNQKITHQLKYEDIQGSLSKLGLDSLNENFWLTVRPNIKKIDEIVEWWKICTQMITPIIEDKEYLELALEWLPTSEWNNQTWEEWTSAIKKHTKKQGRELFMPLRKALTAQEHGPELKYLLPLLGKEKVQKRLKGQTA
jgi:glutamyl-tRNA synthetase